MDDVPFDAWVRHCFDHPVAQPQWYFALDALFAELLAPRSAEVLSHLPETHPDARPLNSICYMWWDLMPIAPAPLVPSRAALDAAILDVMARTLQLDSIAAQEGALHGLGHWAGGYPHEVGAAIDRFLAGTPADPALTAYARRAREGSVL